MKSAAISAAFSFVTALGEFCSLFASIEDVFQCTTVLGRASIAEQLNGPRWSCEEEQEEDCREVPVAFAYFTKSRFSDRLDFGQPGQTRKSPKERAASSQ
jgi:hypothetical protein